MCLIRAMTPLSFRPHISSRCEGGPEVSRELLEERIRFLPDDGLTELADLAEDGEVGVDLDPRADLGRRQCQAHARADASTQSPVGGLGPHARPPRLAVRFLNGDGAFERKADGADLDLEAAFVRAPVDGLEGLDARHATSDRRNIHQQLPQARALDGNQAFLRERHRTPRNVTGHPAPRLVPPATPERAPDPP